MHIGSEIYKRHTIRESVILVKNVSKYFGIKKVLNNINFIVNEGEIFSLIGPNGAGKTTTMRIILGLLVPSAVQVHIFGINPLNSKSFLRNVPAVKGCFVGKIHGVRKHIHSFAYLGIGHKGLGVPGGALPCFLL